MVVQLTVVTSNYWTDFHLFTIIDAWLRSLSHFNLSYIDQYGYQIKEESWWIVADIGLKPNESWIPLKMVSTNGNGWRFQAETTGRLNILPKYTIQAVSSVLRIIYIVPVKREWFLRSFLSHHFRPWLDCQIVIAKFSRNVQIGIQED